jgi:hypothetical protein
MAQLSNNALFQSYLLYQPIRLEIGHEKLMSTAKKLIFFFYIGYTENFVEKLAQ